MERCYVVEMHVPKKISGNNYGDIYDVVKVVSSLGIAERYIKDYYVSEFGDDGKYLLCELSDFNAKRSYYMKDFYGRVDATFFAVSEFAIDDIDWV